MKTNMVDSLMDTYPENAVPAELMKRRDEILEERDRLKAKVSRISVSDALGRSICCDIGTGLGEGDDGQHAREGWEHEDPRVPHR